VTDGNGNSRVYQYDANRRQTKVTYSTGGSVQFTYDADGNRTKMVDLVGTSSYSYDDLNRLQNYTNPAGATLAFTYDAASNRTGLQYPGSKTAQYAYDADNRISTVTDWNSHVASYFYDAAGRMSGVNYTNGPSSQFVYDAVGQNLKLQHTSGGSVVYSESTTWSANGNPTSSDISGLTAPGLASENTSYTYNDGNELASSTYGSPASDNNGNLTSQPGFGGPTAFTYDLNNRATSISGPSVNVTMKYSGDGKLAELDSIGAPHRYLIDPTASGNRILAELDAGGPMQVAYIYGPRGMIWQTSGGQTYLYLHNLQGSTVALVDSVGSVKNSYRYDPFGQKLPASTEQVNNSFSFLGSFSVPTIGQFSLTRYRLYDTRQARFTVPDPAASTSPSLTPYVYANQSPLALIDPSGLSAAPVSGSPGGTAGSTPVSILNVTQPAGFPSLNGLSAYGGDAADILTQIGGKLAPVGFELVSDGAGAWRIVRHDPFGKLEIVGDVVDIGALAVELGIDIGKGNATLGTIWSATGKSAACAVLAAPTLGVGCLVFDIAQSGNNNFIRDVILDFPKNTQTIANWIGDKASSVLFPW